MPTQEEINAANVELQIANDNYAALANRYNKYKQVFEAYASASPEVQERARGAMQAALEDYNKLRDNMLAAENRIAMAQNAVNNINSIMAQPQVSTGGQRRRTVSPTNDQLRLREYLNAGYVIGSDGLMYTPGGVLVNQNGYNINANGQFVPAQVVAVEEESPAIVTDNTTPPQLQTAINNFAKFDQSVKLNPQINPAITTTSKPGTLTSGGSNRASVGEYLGNMWNGITQTYMNPSELVYQSNSRLPGYNLGANLGRAGTVFTIGAGGYGASAPSTTTVPSTFAMPKYTGTPKITTNIPKYVNTLGKSSPTVANLRKNVFVNTLR